MKMLKNIDEALMEQKILLAKDMLMILNQRGFKKPNTNWERFRNKRDKEFDKNGLLCLFCNTNEK